MGKGIFLPGPVGCRLGHVNVRFSSCGNDKPSENSEYIGEPFVTTGFGVSVILRSLGNEECLMVVIPFFTCPYGSILLSDEDSLLSTPRGNS